MASTKTANRARLDALVGLPVARQKGHMRTSEYKRALCKRCTEWRERSTMKRGVCAHCRTHQVEPLMVVFPAQCECGHVYLERYMLPQEREDGCVAFCWCGFCRTRRDVFKANATGKASLDPLVGRRFRRMGQEARVMAVAEGYAMMRFKGCSPFVEYVKDLPKTFYPVDANTPLPCTNDLRQ